MMAGKVSALAVVRRRFGQSRAGFPYIMQRIAEIADDSPLAARMLVAKRRCGEDACFLRKFRVREHIDDLDLLVAAFHQHPQVLEILLCKTRAWRIAGDVKSEDGAGTLES